MKVRRAVVKTLILMMLLILMLILICFLSLFYLSNIHCPEAPYIPVSSTAATVSSGEAPVMRAEGTAKADEIDR